MDSMTTGDVRVQQIINYGSAKEQKVDYLCANK